MAYISTEEVKVIREELKKNFPSREGWKFSVTRRDSHCISVAVMSAPFELRNYEDSVYEQVNIYYLRDREPVLRQIFEIINKTNYNNSDVQSDYFDVGFYINLHIGQYDKPFFVK